MSRQSSLLGAACVAGAATLWGLWPVWVRGAAGGAATAVIALLVGGGLALPLAVAAARARVARGEPARGRREWSLVAVLGVSNAANSWLYFRALDEGAVAPAALSHYLAPVLVALAAPLVLGERRSSRTPPALVLALAGTAVLLLAGRGDTGAGADATRHAVLLGGASALFYATNVITGKKILGAFASAELFAYSCLSSAALLATFVQLPAPSAWLRPAIGGVVSTLVPGFLYYAGLRRLPAERAGVLSYLEVLAGVLVGWIAFHEQPGVAALVGGACIVVAGALVVTARDG